MFLTLLEPLCMYFANSQKGRRIEWAGWRGLSAWEKSERNVRKPNSGKIQKRRETNIFATSDRSVRKVNEELLERWKQRDKYFCQKLRTECVGEIFFFFAIFTSRTFIFKSIFQWWYRRLPSNEIVSYKSGKITHGGSLVTCRQFPRQICQIVWFRSNDFPSTLQPVSTSKWEFSPLVTLSSQEITLTIILTFCTFLSLYLFIFFLLLPMFLRLTAGLSNWHITASHFFSFASFQINRQFFRSLVLVSY